MLHFILLYNSYAEVSFYVHTYIYTHMIAVCICTHTHKCIHLYTHIYTHTSINTHMVYIIKSKVIYFLLLNNSNNIENIIVLNINYQLLLFSNSFILVFCSFYMLNQVIFSISFTCWIIISKWSVFRCMFHFKNYFFYYILYRICALHSVLFLFQ